MSMERREARKVAPFRLSPGTCSGGFLKGYERLDWIHSASEKDPETVYHNLMHHISVANLGQAFRELDGNKACGIDNVTKSEYRKNLSANLEALADEIRRGGWRPKPSREVLIPKPQGGFRSLAVGCLEDKIVQTLLSKILQAIYEPRFSRRSFGFRPGKRAHDALAKVYGAIKIRPDSCTVVEIDIEKFFDNMSHDKLMTEIEKGIDDPHFLRLIRRTLRNSVLHVDGTLAENVKGAPQGAPVSPVLANIYLHAFLDTWFDENWAQHGEMVRFADDAVFVFSDAQKAAAFREALSEHLNQAANIKLNAGKSGTIRFDRHKPEGTVSFLGFDFFWGKNPGKGKLLKTKTSSKKHAKCLQAFCEWIKITRNRKPLDKIWVMAAAKLRGHYNYFGISFNARKLRHFYDFCTWSMFKWLNRRSQKNSFTWSSFKDRLKKCPLPLPISGSDLIDITKDIIPKFKHNSKSRMRKSRTYGSERSAGLTPAFT